MEDKWEGEKEKRHYVGVRDDYLLLCGVKISYRDIDNICNSIESFSTLWIISSVLLRVNARFCAPR